MPFHTPHGTARQLGGQQVDGAGVAKPDLITPALRKPPKDEHLLVFAGIKGADPNISLRAIAARLEELRIRTPRRGTTWSASSVKALLDRAERQGSIGGL